jgi:hypothetical protein
MCQLFLCGYLNFDKINSQKYQTLIGESRRNELVFNNVNK